MMLVLSFRSVVQVMPLGLLSIRYTGAFFLGSGSPSTSTLSPGFTRVPFQASSPLMVTRACSMYWSASRRLQKPVSLMYLLRLVSMGRKVRAKRRLFVLQRHLQLVVEGLE